jgi:hypothetical protein
MAITPAFIWPCFICNDDAELAEILSAPLVKAYVLQIPAEMMNMYGFEHPLGDGWRGYQDINPAVLPREQIVDMLKKVNVDAIRAIVLEWHAAQVRPHPQRTCGSRPASAEDSRLQRYGRIEVCGALRQQGERNGG